MALSRDLKCTTKSKTAKNRIRKKKKKCQLSEKRNTWKVIPRDSCEVYRERRRRRLEENNDDGKEVFGENEMNNTNKSKQNTRRKRSYVRKTRRQRNYGQRRCATDCESVSSTISTYYSRSSCTTSVTVSSVSEMDSE